MLFDPNADAKERQIRAAIVLPRADVDKFVDWMAKNINGIGQLGAVYHLNGEHKTSGPYDGVAQQAIRDEGLRQARGFFYLDPWMEGRKAALAPRDTDGLSFMQLSNNIAIVLMLIAAFKFSLHRRPKPSAIDMQ